VSNYTEVVSKGVDHLLDCDFEFMRLMNNKLVVRDDIMAPLLKNNTNYCYGGSFYFASDTDNMNSLIDFLSHDIVSPITKCRKRRKCQSIYKTLEDFFKANPPDTTKRTIYFVGDAHTNGKHVEVHWNCFIVDKNTIWWYDPSFDEETKRQRVYNFSVEKREKIKTTIGSINTPKTLTRIYGTHRAQQVCTDSSKAIDIFCQSWVLIFAASAIEDVNEEFLHLDFPFYQNKILKAWLKCLFKRSSELRGELQNDSRGMALSYCRIFRDIKDFPKGRVVIEKVPDIPDDGKSCISGVLDFFHSV